jgi:hypothetical protein
MLLRNLLRLGARLIINFKFLLIKNRASIRERLSVSNKFVEERKLKHSYLRVVFSVGARIFNRA